MLKIRLTRKGKRNKAFFRLVVAEHTSPIKGRFLEALGFSDPHTKEKDFKADRIKYWIEKGAQCSDTVHNLLVKEGILKGPKRAVKMKKADKADEAEKVEETAAPDKISEVKEKGDSEKKEEVKTEKTEEAKQETKPEKKTEKEAPAEAAGEK